MRGVRSVVVSAALAAGLAAAGSAGAATFTNGSFEDGVDTGSTFVTLLNGSTGINGWVVGGDSIDYIGGYWQAQDGSRSVDLSGNQSGSVSQTFDTLLGHTYKVSFFLAGNPDGGTGAKVSATSASGGPTQFDIFTVTSSDSHSSMGWSPYTYKFTATGTSTTLTFASATPTPYGPALDNVSIASVPEPAQWALMMLGFGGVGAVMRRARRAPVAA